MISLLCPSRGRPRQARELKESFDQTTSGEAELIFLVDVDDPTLADYPLPFNAWQPTGDPTGPLNRAALRSMASIVGFCGDDSRMETPGWDLMVERALREPGFCWGNDGTGPSAWPSTCFISKEIVWALGWMVPPALRRGFFDVVWAEIAHSTNTAHVIPAMFRHDNSAGDPTSPNFRPEAQVPPEVIAADEAAYKEWHKNEAISDVRKIRSLSLAHFFS